MVGRSGPSDLPQRVIADVVLVLHFLVVVFIVGGLVLTWAGFFLGWKWVGNPFFRYLHLAAIAFVALEALLGYACPLTVWEDALRGGAPPESCLGRWVARVLFYQAPEWVFTALYCLWAAATVATLRFVPPRRKAG
jgi:hypothetical protein